MELSLQKSSRFLLHFFNATNNANKPLSDCITSPKTILPFYFSPKPTAEGEIKPSDNKPNNFCSIKLTRKKRTYAALLLSILSIYTIYSYNRTFSIRPLEQTVKFVCSSPNVTIPKTPKAFKMHPQPNKLVQTYQNQLILRLQVVTTLFKISDNHSTSA